MTQAGERAARGATGSIATALVLHCGEASVAGVVGDLLASEYGGASADRIALPGGPYWLAEAAHHSRGRLQRAVIGKRMPVQRALEAVLGEVALERVVLVGHQGCSWYRRLMPDATPGQVVREQGEDMLRGREELVRWAPRPLVVEGWMLVGGAEGCSFRRLF